MKKILLALLALAAPAFAADLPVKARALPAFSFPTTCTLQGCTGWHVGFDVVNSGTGVNVLNLGALNANGTFLGLDGGYQYFDGQYWLGAKVMASYNLANQGNVGGIGNLFAFEGVEVGGNLFAAFGLAPPQTSGFFSTITSAIPTADIGACQHGKATGFCAGATLHYLLPNTPIEAKLSYLNAQYGTTQITPISSIQSENMVLFGVTYHLQ